MKKIKEIWYGAFWIKKHTEMSYNGCFLFLGIPIGWYFVATIVSSISLSVLVTYIIK